jgi:hypothetical protein
MEFCSYKNYYYNEGRCDSYIMVILKQLTDSASLNKAMSEKGTSVVYSTHCANKSLPKGKVVPVLN